MANPQMNIPNAEPELADLLDIERKRVKLELNCHAVASLTSFNAANQTARAQLAYQQTYYSFDTTSGTTTTKLVPYPLIIDAPVHVAGGGNGALTFPHGAGDECMVCFNDRDIDNWFQGATGGQVATARLHSFSDALILVGFRSLANVIPSYSTSAIELRTKDGTSKVSINTSTGAVVVQAGATGVTVQVTAAGKVTIKNATGTTDLLTALYTILTTATAGGFPLIVDPASLAVLAGLKP
jgi:hypothetical protein